MRRAVLTTLLWAVPLLAAPAQAWGDLADRVALREVLRSHARAATARSVTLPLPEPLRAPTASNSGELAAIARSDEAARLLVGVRAHRDLRGVAGALRRIGPRPEAFRGIGVLAARVPSAAAAVARLRADPRVAYVERDRRLRLAQGDPFDVVDPLTGIKYTWAYDEVRAGDALAAARGGSRRTVAVLDTGVDVNHPELVGRIGRTFDTASGGADVTDVVGHGTFVTGLISAIEGNGIGGKGVAGATQVMAVRGSTDGSFTIADLLRGMDFAVSRGADVLNLSLAGETFSLSQARALDGAFINGVLSVAASGNKGDHGNPLAFPAAALGGERGGRGIGLSVAATRPDGAAAPFSSHNAYVSLAAPGAGSTGCPFGVFSTLPAGRSEWDDPLRSCSLTFPRGGARYAYGEGTSFATPIAAGIAALTWQVEPRLASEQVADVLVRSARQTVGTGWNEFTGAGIVDGAAAAALARRYDVTAPRVRAKLRRRGNRVAVRVLRSGDRTEGGRELAGEMSYGLFVSRDGGRSFNRAVRQRARPFRTTLLIRGSETNVVAAIACDGNVNCGVKRVGRFRRR
ncbi:MAG: S8 family serine peptidase [Thermoleophilaceae bacterium]|nr:S8 family serine peptidase [Thermoleophilaceae bacterium]